MSKPIASYLVMYDVCLTFKLSIAFSGIPLESELKSKNGPVGLATT